MSIIKQTRKLNINIDFKILVKKESRSVKNYSIKEIF